MDDGATIMDARGAFSAIFLVASKRRRASRSVAGCIFQFATTTNFPAISCWDFSMLRRFMRKSGGTILLMRYARGFALIELLISIAIIMILATMTYGVLYTTNTRKALDTDALKVVTKLGEARSLTLAAKNDREWGIRLASRSITLFEGSAYDSESSSNIVVKLNPLVTLSSTLQGDGSDVIFERLSGDTAQYGTTTVSLIASSTVARTIIIYETGVVEMQ